VGADTNVEALRRVEAIAVHEQDAEAGERLATPASRRPGRMGTTFDLEVDPERLALAATSL
jgi:hypothetical protein